MHSFEVKSLLKESGLVLVLHVGSELDLSLDPCKLTGFIKGDRVGSIQYIIPSLLETEGGQVRRRNTSRKMIQLQRQFTKQSSVMSTYCLPLNALWLQRGCLLSE